MGHQVVNAEPQLDFIKANSVVMNMFYLSAVNLVKDAATMGRAITDEYLEPCTIKLIHHAESLSLGDVLESFEIMRHARLVHSRSIFPGL